MGFEELGKTLQELGASPRELLVLRFLKTEIPFEEAVEKIGRLASGDNLSNEVTTAMSSGEAVDTKAEEDVEMSDALTADPVPPPAEGDSEQASHSQSPARSPQPNATVSPPPSEPAAPKVSVYQPSKSAQLAAASVNVPEEAYEVGIEDVKRMRAKYHELAQPQRLPSDKEIEEKNAALREEMEKVAIVWSLQSGLGHGSTDVVSNS